MFIVAIHKVEQYAFFFNRIRMTSIEVFTQYKFIYIKSSSGCILLLNITK